MPLVTPNHGDKPDWLARCHQCSQNILVVDVWERKDRVGPRETDLAWVRPYCRSCATPNGRKVDGFRMPSVRERQEARREARRRELGQDE